MRTGYHPWKNSRIHYYCWGTGDKLVCCFHGYGESAESFAFLGEAAGTDFTLMAIDLPFHGKTEWNEGTVFHPEDLLSILDGLVAGLSATCAIAAHPAPIHSVPHTKCLLLGYSMGGRIAMTLLEKSPDRIGRLVLISPDGMTMNPWYWLATQTTLGNRFFKWTMQRPGWLFLLLRLGNALRLVNPSVYKFAVRYIDDEQVRQHLYTRWTTMRSFRPHPALFRQIILAKKLTIRLIYGSHDRIIRWQNGQKFCKELPGQCELTLLPGGHQILQVKHIDTILSALE